METLIYPSFKDVSCTRSVFTPSRISVMVSCHVVEVLAIHAGAREDSEAGFKERDFRSHGGFPSCDSHGPLSTKQNLGYSHVWKPQKKLALDTYMLHICVYMCHIVFQRWGVLIKGDCHSTKIIWLVVWLPCFIFPLILGLCHHPN